MAGDLATTVIMFRGFGMQLLVYSPLVYFHVTTMDAQEKKSNTVKLFCFLNRLDYFLINMDDQLE
jgi:hypothetical protein